MFHRPCGHRFDEPCTRYCVRECDVCDDHHKVGAPCGPRAARRDRAGRAWTGEPVAPRSPSLAARLAFGAALLGLSDD